MHVQKLLVVILIATFSFTACKTDYKFKLNSPKKTTLGKNFSVNLEEVNGKVIDSTLFYVNNKKVVSTNSSAIINSKDFGVGKHKVTAIAFYPGNAKKINNFVEVFADTKPVIYTYKIVNTYPHDKKAYTQGLEFNNGVLYETTGRRGKSWLRKVDYKTGKVLQQEDLDEKYFGEGMTILNNKIYWLTWQAGRGFVYNLDTFKEEGSFEYLNSNQGWGLTHSKSEIIKSDGTNRIWFLDSKTQKEKRSIQVYTNDRTIDRLNEIEYVDGKIYSNWWKTDGKINSTIIIINPETGIVEGLVGLNNLRKEILKDQKLNTDEVLNGIAYNEKTKTFFVTGKHWGKLFEIELVKK